MRNINFDKQKIIKKYKDKKIAVIYGGWSEEREISIKTGIAILDSLKAQGVNAFGFDLTMANLDELNNKNIDIAYIAMHGKGGEDGKLQAYLELKNIKYTGSNSLASAIAMDKYYTKKILDANSIPTPKYFRVNSDKFYNNIQKFQKMYKLDFPCVVKAGSQGSAIGVHIVYNLEDLKIALKDIKKVDKYVLVEEYIKGREFTVGVVGNLVLPVLEIISENEFYDFEAKYKDGKSKHSIPNDLDKKILENMKFLAKKTFELIGCKGVSRIDVMMDNNNNLYVLEINTIPGMTKTSLLPDAAEKIDISFDDLVLMILDS